MAGVQNGWARRSKSLILSRLAQTRPRDGGLVVITLPKHITGAKSDMRVTLQVVRVADLRKAQFRVEDLS